MRVKTEMIIYQPHRTLEKCVLECIQLNRGIYVKQIYLKSTYWKKLLQWNFVPPKEQILKYPLQTYTHPLEKLSN